MLGALWLFALVVLLAFHSVVLPFAAAALVAYIIAPLVRWLTARRVGGRHLPRWGAVLIVYGLFFLAVFLFLITLVPQLYREMARISRDTVEYANSLTPARIQEIAEKSERWLSDHGIPVSLSARALEGDTEGELAKPHLSLDLEQGIHDAASKLTLLAKENLGNIVAISRKVVVGVLTTIFGVFFILMVAAFLSIDVTTVLRYLQTMVPPEVGGDATMLARRIDRSLSGVVRGQLTICLVNGTLTLIGLIVFGVKFAFLLATVATLFSLIPIFGTILSSVPILVIALTHSWRSAFGMLLWILGIHALEAYVLNPKIMGSAAKIHPVVVAFALLAGEHAGGILGALFALPICAVGMAAFDFAREMAQPPALPGGDGPKQP